MVLQLMILRENLKISGGKLVYSVYFAYICRQ